jgi:hypothetical protein
MIAGMTNQWQIESVGQADRETRTSKLLSVDISSARFARTRVVVRNLSSYGLGARSEIDLLPTEQITVHLPNGHDVAAIVRWVRRGTFGLSLGERIDPATLQTRNALDRPITTRDAKPGFEPFRVQAATQQRTGFQRSHRDEVLSSSWRNDDE